MLVVTAWHVVLSKSSLAWKKLTTVYSRNVRCNTFVETLCWGETWRMVEPAQVLLSETTWSHHWLAPRQSRASQSSQECIVWSLHVKAAGRFKVRKSTEAEGVMWLTLWKGTVTAAGKWSNAVKTVNWDTFSKYQLIKHTIGYFLLWLTFLS